jgi:hypothetical protein
VREAFWVLLTLARLVRGRAPIKGAVSNLQRFSNARDSIGARRDYQLMRPLTVITGIVLGSSVSITVSLAAVLFIFLVLGDAHPRLDSEFGALINSLLIFSAMTVISGLSFYSLLIRHRWRGAAQILMWLGLAATGTYYWP